MISLITCTGGRPAAFELCCRWMSQQTYQGKAQWIIVDDCEPPMDYGAISSDYLPPSYWAVPLICPRPAWQPGQNTQVRNMEAALDAVAGDPVFVIEDDDYYRPEYIEAMLAFMKLSGATIIGEGGANYYNLQHRCYRTMGNGAHASLCQTAFAAEHIPLLRNAMASGNKFIDIAFWDLASLVGAKTALLTESRLCVGIKGMPGRAGIGTGHSPVGYEPDPNLERLKQWVGEDWICYEPFTRKEDHEKARRRSVAL